MHVLGQLSEQRQRQRDTKESDQQLAPTLRQEMPNGLDHPRRVRQQARDVAQDEVPE
jgi:hypothetical protein